MSPLNYCHAIFFFFQHIMTFWCQIIFDVTKPWREAGCHTFLFWYLGLMQVTAGFFRQLIPMLKRYMLKTHPCTFSQRYQMIWHMWFINRTFVSPGAIHVSLVLWSDASFLKNLHLLPSDTWDRQRVGVVYLGPIPRRAGSGVQHPMLRTLQGQASSTSSVQSLDCTMVPVCDAEPFCKSALPLLHPGSHSRGTGVGI